LSDPLTSLEAGSPAGLLRLSGVVGLTHQIQPSETFASNSWQAFTNITLTNTSQAVTDPAATNVGQRFYRTQLLP